MFTFNKNKKGITLTEVLFSAGIIALVASGILVVFVQTIDISKRINYEYTATNLAKSRVERARTIIATNGFDSLSDLTESDTIIDSEGSPDQNGEFNRSTTVATNYGGDSRLAQIDVTIIYAYQGEWKTGAAITMTTVFSSIE